MRRTLVTVAAFATTLALASSPALAGQRRDRGNRGRPAAADNGGRAVPRAQPRGNQAPPPAPRTFAPRAWSRSSPRGAESRRLAPPAESRRVPPRAESRTFAPRVDPRTFSPRAEPRRNWTPRIEPRREMAVPRAVPRAQYRNYGYGHDSYYRGGRAVIVAPRSYYRPYYAYRPYAFRPRLRIGFNVFLGFPVRFAYYPYPVPVYGYGAPVGPVVVGPDTAIYGGVSLEFTPVTAEVWVDGSYVGTVADFDGTREPLTLTAGVHHLDVRAPGYEPLPLDVTVAPGQVIPYRGDLLPY